MASEEGDKILLAHGGGGRLTDELIRNTIQPRFKDSLIELADSANLNLDSNDICFTTDSYVVKPLFFSGGDIGKLAVCGTINDLAVVGARPIAMSLSLIIEAGFDLKTLEKILDSASQTSQQNHVKIVTGDTKTVEAGAADGIFVNTSAVGVRLPCAQLGFNKIAADDEIIINGPIGDHGMTIISQREGMKFETSLSSDCAALWPLIEKVLQQCEGVKFMRDPTRGGLAATFNEIAISASHSIELDETEIPINPTVQAAADVLGFDVLNIANEGKVVIVVSPKAAQQCLTICREHPLGKEASIIGRVCQSQGRPLVELRTKIGGRRIVQMPYGTELPRIC